MIFSDYLVRLITLDEQKLLMIYITCYIHVCFIQIQGLNVLTLRSVVCLLMFHHKCLDFSLLLFILRGDLYSVCLFFFFSVILALRVPRLGKRELVCVFYVRLFVLRLWVCVSFLFFLVSRLAATCDCGTPWTFLFNYYFFFFFVREV